MNGYPRDLHVLTHSFPTRRSSDLLTSANFPSEVEDKIMYSIIHKQPKRADIYWLVHVDVMDVPYGREYKVQTFIPNHLIRIDFRLGFREEQRVNLLFRKVVEEMVKNKEVSIISRYASLRKHKITGDFRFVILDRKSTRIWTLPLLDRKSVVKGTRVSES